MFVLLYAISRFVIEFYRGDERGIHVQRGLHVAVIPIILAPLAHLHALVLCPSGAAAAPEAPRGPAEAAVCLQSLGSWVLSGLTRQTFTVPPEAEGAAARSFLAPKIPDYSRSQIQRLIDEGHVVCSRVKQSRPTAQCAKAT